MSLGALLDMRLEPIILKADTSIPKLLAYYMGKNTPERQQFIVENLRWEMDAPQGVALASEESAVPALTEG